MKLENMLLFSSFLQIDGISRNKEMKLWAAGIDTLEKLQATRNQQQSFFENPEDETSIYLEALRRGDASVFLSKLEAKDYFRVAYSFPEKVMFLDIETTGLSTQYHYITMVGWMINGQYDYWLQGTHPQKLLDTVASAELLVTYNGILFDCKFLDHAFDTNLFTSKPNLDLMHMCRRFALTGGQKNIEDIVGFDRPISITTTNGKEAIAQWYEFLFGSNAAIKDLIQYNYYDIQGMAYILDWVFFKYIYGHSYPKNKQGHPLRFAKVSKKIAYPKKQTCDDIRIYTRDHISNFSMKALSKSMPYRIVGIDLAGKVSSRTGGCFLNGNHAVTKVFHENEDIKEFVRSCDPDLISIDAPLSLPKGRTSVYDDDPYREECGILRYCERILKKRNVNSYPALIRSMQELTKRGIELAAYFRSQGYPVIECFPGAAQDIIQLPRKRTDETLLKHGLSRLGIHGPFEVENVCHDELDAVTASLVGQFFISGFYEPLGIPEENDMIIPQKTYRESPYSVVIGVCGPISTGKTEASEYIKSKGFEYIRYSQVLANDLTKKATKADRATLQKEGWGVYSGAKQYDLNRRLEQHIHGHRYVVIDGMRHLEDYTYWKERCFSNFHLIYIDTDYSARELRYANKFDSSVDYAAAVAHPVESHVSSLREKADLIIINDGTKDDLYQKIDDFLSRIE